MTGKMYKPKLPDRMFDDDYIAIETLNNVVCLMNNRTNSVYWVTKHILNTEFKEKEKTE